MFQSTLWGNNIDGTTISLILPETARTHWPSWPNKAGFLSFRATGVADLACAADVVWWRRPDINLKLIGTFCTWCRQQLTVYLKESGLANNLYCIYLSFVNPRVVQGQEVTGTYPGKERRQCIPDRSPAWHQTSQAIVWTKSTLF